MVRSIALRGFDQVLLPELQSAYSGHFDSYFLSWLKLKLEILFWVVQQMAGLVTDYMEAYGTKFAWKCVPKRVDKLSSGALQVTWTDTHTGKEHEDTYDSVLWAVGESVCGSQLGASPLKSELKLNSCDNEEWNI